MSTKKAELTTRQKDILSLLAKFTPETPATVATLAETLQISTRTILREMPAIEKWLKTQNIQCTRKPGVGMALVASPNQLQSLQAQLSDQEEHSFYPKDQRRRLVLSILLTQQEPVKVLSLSKQLKTSEGTLTSDLDYVQIWLQDYNVSLHRKPGLGLYLCAQEMDLRQAMVALAQESLPEAQHPALFQRSTPLLPEMQPLFPPQRVGELHRLLTTLATEQSIRFDERGYGTLVFYLAITLERLSQGYFCDDVPSMVSLSEALVAQNIAQKLEDTMHIQLPPKEVAQLTKQLIPAIDHMPHETIEDKTETLALRQLVLQMIEQVGASLECSFSQDELLVPDLIRHMGQSLRRLRLGVGVKNPHTQEIQTQYPLVYQATKTACELLESPTGIAKIPESEVAFIAMHFCAAHQRMHIAQRKLSVVITCPTGLGMSRILAANLSKEFKQLDIKGVVSAMRLAPQWLKDQGIDLVISTVAVELDFPLVCVSPALRLQDKILINETIQRLATIPKKTVVQKPFDLRGTIQYMDELGKEILRLVDHLVLYRMERVGEKNQLIAKAAGLFVQDTATRTLIEQDLQAREAISETYIDEGQMLLLHCKTAGVTHCQLGYIRLIHPLDNQGKQVSGAIVMLIPQDPSRVHVEMMGQISAAFLQNQGLYLSVQRGTVPDFAREVEKVLTVYYQKTLQLLS